MKSPCKSTTIAILTALVALAVAVVAQSNRIPIGIKYSGTDNVGKSFNYALKEQLTPSGVFHYSTGDEGLVLVIGSVKVTEYDSAIAITLISRTKDYGDFYAN